MKFRCKVIRHIHVMSYSVSKMSIFGGFGDFSVRGGALAPWTRGLALKRMGNWTS